MPEKISNSEELGEGIEEHIFKIIMMWELADAVAERSNFGLVTDRYGGEDPKAGEDGSEGDRLAFLDVERCYRRETISTRNDGNGYPPRNYKLTHYNALNPNKVSGKK